MAKLSRSTMLILLFSIATQFLLSSADLKEELGALLHPQGRLGYVLSHKIKCKWKVYVKTGNRYGAGTDAVVSLKVYDKNGDNVTVSNLEKFGVRPQVSAATNIPFQYVKVGDPRYDFFERGQLDEFNFEDRCITYNICKVKLSHNNGGSMPGWFVDYIIVQDGPDSDYTKPYRFNFNRWLDSGNGASATIDLCEN